MIAPFTLHRPASLGEASSLLSEFREDARVLAGGSELILLLKMGLAEVSHIVDIKRIPGLAQLDYDAGANLLRIGPLVTHRDLEKSAIVRAHFPLIVQMEKQLANVRIRNVGTLAGNISFAEPHADPGTLLMAHNAGVTLLSGVGERVLNLEDFFVDYYETVLRKDELLAEITFPNPQKIPWRLSPLLSRGAPHGGSRIAAGVAQRSLPAAATGSRLRGSETSPRFGRGTVDGRKVA